MNNFDIGMKILDPRTGREFKIKHMCTDGYLYSKDFKFSCHQSNAVVVKSDKKQNNS